MILKKHWVLSFSKYKEILFSNHHRNVTQGVKVH